MNINRENHTDFDQYFDEFLQSIPEGEEFKCNRNDPQLLEKCQSLAERYDGKVRECFKKLSESVQRNHSPDELLADRINKAPNIQANESAPNAHAKIEKFYRKGSPTPNNQDKMDVSNKQPFTHQNLHNIIGELHTVKSIKNRLENNENVIVFGAPASGKTEQLQFALGKKVPIFDLRSQFVTYYCKKNRIQKENINNFKKIKYKTNKIKSVQKEWIIEQKNNITKELSRHHEDTIIFDEFDLAVDDQLNQNELETATTLLKIARDLKNDHNKKVILILHQEGLHSNELMVSIKNVLELSKNDLVYTEYVQPNQEEGLLSLLRINEDDSKKLRMEFEGIPCAYLPLLIALTPEKINSGDLNLITADTLRQDAVKSIKKMFKVAKFTASQEVQVLLIKLAHQMITLDDVSKEQKELLLETGLVGRIHNQFIIPKLVAEVISKETDRPE